MMARSHTYTFPSLPIPRSRSILESHPLQPLSQSMPHDVPKHISQPRLISLSFFLFGLINNVLYVIILSAALDLVPLNTPKGIIAFVNIFPALVAKLGGGWFVESGGVRYAIRLNGCTILSITGMLIVAFSTTLAGRLTGIALASFSSGLGELTFLQLSTTYGGGKAEDGARSVGYFASGTGAAGLVGAFLWWEMRGLGVRLGVGLSSILPIVIPLTYAFILPPTTSSADYERIPANEQDTIDSPPQTKGELTMSEKWALVRPMLLTYMLPLFFVYLIEYTINQGISPTLIYPIPSPSRSWLLSKIIHSIRDYYPLWQLVYQSTVFLSRSSLSLGLPPLPARLIPLPAIIQAIILISLIFESSLGIFGEGEGSTWAVGALIAVEGVCGGLAYVNVFYRINQQPSSSALEREFTIGSVGFADSLGIVGASLMAVPVEVWLCSVQVRRGKEVCLSV